MTLQCLRVSSQLGELIRVHQSKRGRDNRETHQNVGSGQVLAAEVLAPVGRGLELVLQECKVGGVVPVQECLLDLGGHDVCDGLEEEWDGGVSDACTRLSSAISWEEEGKGRD